MKDRPAGGIEQYLASEAAQGLFLDQGEFRVAADKALEKLSRFALPGPGLWVVKMLQAAVAAGAPKVDFVFDRRRVTVKFANLEGWDAEELLQQLLGAALPGQSSRRHLFAGILGAAMGFSQRIDWACGKTAATVDKDGPRTRAGQAGEMFVFTARRPWRPAFKSGLLTSPIKYLIRQTVEEYKALVEHCGVSPAEVTVDKRKLPSSYQTFATKLPAKVGYNSDKSTGMGVLLAQIPVCGDRHPSLPYPIDDIPLTRLEQEREKFESLFLYKPTLDPVQAVVCVYSCLQRESRLNLVMDGVCLNRRNLYPDRGLKDLQQALEDDSENLALDVFLAVSWEDLDLTQFAVREQSFSHRVSACVPALIEVLERMEKECLREEWELRQGPPESVGHPVSVVELMGIGFLSLFIPHAIVLGGICGGVFVTYKAVQATGLGQDWIEEKKRSAHKRKAEEFQARMRRIISGLRKLEPPASAWSGRL